MTVGKFIAILIQAEGSIVMNFIKPFLKSLRPLVASIPLFMLSARAAVVNATWNSSSGIPVTATSYTATGNTVNLTLNFAPEVGTNLTVVNNAGLPFIQGAFNNLPHGQKVALTFNGISYNFVTNYYGGDGNDLVLQWADNRIMAWGSNSSGRLGDGTTSTRTIPTSVVATGALKGKTILSVSAGEDHSLALCSDGSVAAWGENSSGQLGTNNFTDSLVPVSVIQTGVLATKTVIAVSAGRNFCLALCSDGTIAAWGAGASGQLGNNITANSSIPVMVSTSGALSGKTIVKISAGIAHSLALCSDGALVAWGSNAYGAFGNNSTTNSLTPVLIPAAGALVGKTLSGISAGFRHSLACADGLAMAWGYNDYSTGVLGNGSTAERSLIPVAVTSTGILSGKTVSSVSAGESHSVAVCSDGTVATWGSNSSGQLGDNSSLTRSSPVGVFPSAVFTGKTVIAVDASWSGFSAHTVVQFSDGSLAAWGENVSGQLGNSTTTDAFAGVAVDSSTLTSSGERFMVGNPGFSAGSDHTLALAASPPRPTVETLAASSLSSSGATLNAAVNANSNSTAVTFQYGLTTSYGTTVNAAQTPINGNNETAVSANITGLVPGTTYNYRVVATNALGTTIGANRTFIAASNNANLSAMTLSTGTLAPSFNPNTGEYTASVSNTTTSITVRPTLADTTASVRVNGVVVNSGTNSGAIDLAVG